MYRSGGFLHRRCHSAFIVKQPVDESELFFLSLFVNFPPNMFSLNVCWNGAERHHSCQHSASLSLLRSLAENRSSFFNVPMENEQQAFPSAHLHPRGSNLVSFADVALFIYGTFSPACGKWSAGSCGGVWRQSNCNSTG